MKKNFCQKSYIRWTCVAAICLLVGSFASSRTDAAEAAAGRRIERHDDLVYQTVGEVRLRLDLARPVDAQSAPVIVFIHGGGWVSGRRDRFRESIEEAAHRGYVAVTITYRLAKTREQGGSENGFPAGVEDVCAALRFLEMNQQRFGADPQRIALWGESAGAHLALMTALTSTKTGTPRCAAVINFFGPTDLADLSRRGPAFRAILLALLGESPEQAADAYRAASPIFQLGGNPPPILTIHGERDPIVPVDQARRFDAAMRAAGHAHDLIVYPDAGHGFKADGWQAAQTAAYRFLEKCLRPNNLRLP